MKVAKLPNVAPIKREFEEVFDRFFGPAFPFAPVGFEPPVLRTKEYAWMPPLDLVEREKEYVVRLDVPGVPRENLDVQLEGAVLTLTGHREMGKKEELENYLWEETETGKFIRTIRLPKAVEANKIEATYQDGILTVRLPKTEPAIKNKILIKG
ncbi:MAG TPA: Hsp20/alpha crystallin family protein [Gemmatimonadales bacterium]|jgi:HSP20 family protein